MYVSGIYFHDFVTIVDHVNDRYAGNIAIHDGYRELNGPRFRARIRAIESGAGVLPAGQSAPGARRSGGPGERRGPWACWHAYRDVIAGIFELNSDAIVRTALETYSGRTGFEQGYPMTGWRNMGSLAYPRRMPQLCDCPPEIRGTDD